VFLSVCFVVLLALFSTRLVSLATLIQIPNATFILTYLGGCAAGLRLLQDSRLGTTVSLISLIMSAVILLFVRWTILYAVAIAIVWLAFTLKTEIKGRVMGS
jgi:amino acid efflux transporter